MIERYISNEEYETYYDKLEDLRFRVAKNLPLKPNMYILDLATGYGYFALEIAKIYKKLKVVGIDISKSCIRNSIKNIKRLNLQDRVNILEMDATKMTFDDEEFDAVVSFIGLEDIHMTRGRRGVLKTFDEVNRVLEPGGCFFFVVMLPEEVDTDAQRIELALFSYICDATWLSGKEYRSFAEKAGFKIKGEKVYYTGKKLTKEQAKCEIKYAVRNVPKIYGKPTPSFKKIWNKFGNDIEKHGLGHCSKVILKVAEKIK